MGEGVNLFSPLLVFHIFQYIFTQHQKRRAKKIVREVTASEVPSTNEAVNGPDQLDDRGRLSFLE
jgi:hypothetical protein